MVLDWTRLSERIDVCSQLIPVFGHYGVEDPDRLI
jgi:hypothetical protein